MNKIINFIKNIDVYIGPIILLAILIDVFLQVVSRVLPGNSISWTVEVGEMLLGALIWFGLSVGVATNGHVAFDLLVKKFPPKTRKIFGIIANGFFIAHVVLLGSFTWTLLEYYTKLGSKSTILGISMFWVRMPILLGCIFTLIRLLVKEYRIIRGQEVAFPDDQI
ncbi:TRAP transporter small permease [Petroclostridium sp. X23]|uniref:TRAP transporter small permease n=1 Tax=Petroclostridium sp. X23 TaxID=3045146 RepID=UPI0024AE852D|nr:TRAP transporter small permease [Petroclostridium sp. X23]WHH59096.1 TRAP transporter small permease [Petroclostridium sp. X23]